MNSLYALRFFASFAIYLHHLYYPYGFGAVCVTFFFVLSGFTMAYSLNKKEFILNRKSLKQFYLNKVVKFYPLYVLTFIASIPIMHFLNIKINMLNILINLSLLQSYFPNKNVVFMFNGLSWFIADIIFFYLVTPFLFKLIMKYRINKNNKVLMLIIVLLYIISLLISYHYSWNVDAYSFGWWLIYISPFFRMFDYIIGFLICFIFINLKDYKKNIAKYNSIFSLLEVFSILLLFLLYKSKYILNDSLRYGVYYIPALTFIILIFAFGRGVISKIISIKLFIYLGKLSFVIYLVHQIIIYYTSMYIGNTMYYTESMNLNNYISQIYLFIIVICISDSIDRYILPLTNKFLLSKIFK